MGIDIQRDGTLKFNDLNFFDAQGGDLQAILSQGVKVGFSSTSQSAIASVTFKALQAGQSITVSGLTLTATSNASAEKVASAFANIGSSGNPNATDFGIFNGVLVGWTSESNTNGNVIFNSTTKKRVDTSLVASGSGGTLPTISFNGQNDLNHFIDGLIGITGFSGSLADMIKSENTQLSSLNNRQADLKDRLAIVQNSLISQYSALNALLYQFSQTNNALTSALDAISNNSKN
jgi:flagellar capping protein FliD